jgi:hypothetical protein
LSTVAREVRPSARAFAKSSNQCMMKTLICYCVMDCVGPF